MWFFPIHFSHITLTFSEVADRRKINHKVQTIILARQSLLFYLNNGPIYELFRTLQKIFIIVITRLISV